MSSGCMRRACSRLERTRSPWHDLGYSVCSRREYTGTLVRPGDVSPVAARTWGALRPLHFLAIPPSLFAKVIANLKTDESHPVYEYHPGSWGSAGGGSPPRSPGALARAEARRARGLIRSPLGFGTSRRHALCPPIASVARPARRSRVSRRCCGEQSGAGRQTLLIRRE